MDKLSHYQTIIKQALTEYGIPGQAIVLGFQPPDIRQYSAFAVA